MVKAKTKQFRTSIWQSDSLAFKSIKPFYRLLRFTYLFSFNKFYRNDRLTQLKYHSHTLQPNSTTTHDRYPELFTLCKDFFAGKNNLKFLSFGCSSGEEVFSLSQYLPEAHITGVDINKFCLSQAINKNTNPNLSFMHSLSSNYLTSSGYDAIFCLAVLQHTQNRDNVKSARKFTFKRFEQQINQLDNKLKPGGLLIIDHCDFNFLDTEIARKYTTLAVANNKIIRNRPLFDKNNQKQSSQTNNYRAFIKQG